MKRLLAVLVMGALLAPPAFARELVDLSGRPVLVPDTVHKVYGAFSSTVAALSAIAPDRLAGVYYTHTPVQDRFLPPVMTSLPLLTVSGPQTWDPERVLALGVDLAVVMTDTGLSNMVRDRLASLGIAAVAIRGTRVRDYPESFRFLGRVFGREERGETLARFIEDGLERLDKTVGTLPEAERRRVYYTESPDGLQSQCANADRAEVLILAGARNVLVCEGVQTMASQPQVTPETLLALDPDVIVARFPEAARRFRTDPRWADLRAVRDNQVFVAPQLPFNWVDRPPSYMRLMGAFWLAHTLYPDRFPLDLPAHTRLFLETFFQISPSDEAIAALLDPEAAP
ncbi:ABC transporter substrate-binding protein [Pararhodospirillum oryzae]|uniref:Iron ABC transporter substrate-binding protein n=1 Tax=Pararhodospirillum oryzae TaxID=478448 RepID=A0A512H6F3_9PROT|nr:ABC transporter substrate-binding protein [Pararhodospirillum oryzae]GEO81027.1 iron ABC transporter substrate-binding protein [Pararhodospirillum oryzae]